MDGQSYFVVKNGENKKRSQSCGSEGVEGLEEEDELEVLGNLLESEANRGDCEEPWDVEEDGQDNDGKHMGEGDESGGAMAGSLLDKEDY